MTIAASLQVMKWVGMPLEQLRPNQPNGPDGFPMPDDDSHWDVFLPDDDEVDPVPDPGDFWIEPEE
jgi:hypothetical protein